jgi:activating signal cointegrator 1
MKAISIWQPWASLIGNKAYETRGWEPPASLIGKDLAICAAKNATGMGIAFGDPRLRARCRELLGSEWSCDLPFGCVVSVARLAFVIRTDGTVGSEVLDSEKLLGDWSPGRFAWRLENVRRLTPIPVRGAQGIFDLPADVLCQVNVQLAAVA